MKQLGTGGGFRIFGDLLGTKEEKGPGARWYRTPFISQPLEFVQVEE